MLQLSRVFRFRGKRQGTSLGLDVKDLATPIHPVVRINTVWTEESAIGRICRDLRQAETIGSAALAAALLGCFAFWLSHDVLDLKS